MFKNQTLFRAREHFSPFNLAVEGVAKIASLEEVDALESAFLDFNVGKQFYLGRKHSESTANQQAIGV